MSREWPAPAILAGSRLVDGTPVTIDLSEPAVWSGDRIAVVCPRGVPVIPSGGTYAPCPDGHSFYNDGTYDTGPAVLARTVGGAMYDTGMGGDERAFYETNLSTTTSGYYYANRDDLDSVTLYTDEIDAINGTGASGLTLANVDCGTFAVLAAPSGTYTPSTITSLNLELTSATPQGEQTGETILSASLQSTLAADLDTLGGVGSGWKLVACLSSWVFETNVDMLDLNAIGQEFGESTKGLLRGAGSFQADIDYRQNTAKHPASTLLKLMLLTQTGAKATARFVVAPPASAPTLNEPMCYETAILFSKTSVNVAATELISMSADFISTGRIRLVTAPLS
jgi:hypothetical protein